MKQLINNTCQLKLQSGMFGVTSLFISYNITPKSIYIYIYITAGEDIDIFMTHSLTP